MSGNSSVRDTGFINVSWPGLVRLPTTCGVDASNVVGGRAKPGRDTKAAVGAGFSAIAATVGARLYTFAATAGAHFNPFAPASLPLPDSDRAAA
jgi:hypothetical protein